MAVSDLTAESLSRDIGAEVHDIYIVIAKHEALGFDARTIQEITGLSESEWAEVQADETYRKVLLLIRNEHARAQVETDLSYDRLEEVALKKLIERAPHERDTDILLRIATVANRAQRRTKRPEVLDPSSQGVRIPLTLSSRMVRRLSTDGSEEQTIERKITTHGTPTFADVDGFLHVTAKPYMDKPTELKSHKPDPSLDELMLVAEKRK